MIEGTQSSDPPIDRVLEDLGWAHRTQVMIVADDKDICVSLLDAQVGACQSSVMSETNSFQSTKWFLPWNVGCDE